MSFSNSLSAERRNSIRLTMIGGLLALAATLWGQSPNVSGTWEMDATKSQVSDGRTMTLVIETAANKLKVESTTHDKSGKEMKSEFTCAPDGKECECNEGGHKSKVSMWFSGDSLNVAKTDGPAGDVVNEWKLQRSADGKVLTVGVTHIEPDGPAETLVFIKKN